MSCLLWAQSRDRKSGRGWRVKDQGIDDWGRGKSGVVLEFPCEGTKEGSCTAINLSERHLRTIANAIAQHWLTMNELRVYFNLRQNEQSQPAYFEVLSQH